MPLHRIKPSSHNLYLLLNDMPASSLPEPVTEAFHTIVQGQQFPFAWLATSDENSQPRVTTIRLSGFNLVKGNLFFCCHANQPEAIHLRRRPQGEICLTDLNRFCQLRLFCRYRFLGEQDAPMIRRFWEKLPEDRRFKIWGYTATKVDPPDEFLVVEATIIEIVLWDLSSKTQELKMWLKHSQSWLPLRNNP